MRIRSAEPPDLDLLCQLRIEFLSEYRGVAPDAVTDHFVDETRRFFQRTLDDGTVLTWIAEDQARPVGIVSVVLQDVAIQTDSPTSLQASTQPDIR
jgi:hypothetical protein